MPAPPWRSPDWLEPMLAWTDARLAEAGLRRTGPPSPRDRPWSIVLELPTSDGPRFAKETAASMANDAGLTGILAELAPSLVVRPLAADASRRRMLIPYAGERLRDRLERDPDLAHWERILPRYAELQLATAPLAEALLEAGALDRRPHRLPELLTALLDDPVAAGSDGARRAAPVVRRVAGELSGSGAPATIQHDDLHDGNVLVEGGSSYRIVDWGDACIGHPFGSLLVTLRSIADRFGADEHGAELQRLRDAYLEPWRSRLGRVDLEEEVARARWLAMVGRALIWREVGRLVTDPDEWDWRAGVTEWLADLAAAAPA
jgi:Phosphotransferase enzyme family